MVKGVRDCRDTGLRWWALVSEGWATVRVWVRGI